MVVFYYGFPHSWSPYFGCCISGSNSCSCGFYYYFGFILLLLHRVINLAGNHVILRELFTFEFRADRRNSAAIFGAGFWIFYAFASFVIWLEVSRSSELPFLNNRRFSKKPLVAFVLPGSNYLNFQRSVSRVLDGVFVYILSSIFLFGLFLPSAAAFAVFGRRLVPFFRHFNCIYLYYIGLWCFHFVGYRIIGFSTISASFLIALIRNFLWGYSFTCTT